MTKQAGKEANAIVHGQRVAMFQNRHAWIFSGALRNLDGSPADGDMVAVRSPSGEFLARGYWNSLSQIRVHAMTWQDEPIDEAFWQARLARAINHRKAWRVDAGATRLVNAENDGLPGLVVDRYGPYLVLQALTLGIDQRKHMLADILWHLVPDLVGIYERSDADVRKLEGLQPATGVLRGEAPPELFSIREGEKSLLVDLYGGHKTGFYLDQAANRNRLSELVRQYRNSDDYIMLNTFSYSGGFSISALQGGASRVVNVESSEAALDLARRNYTLNQFAVDPDDFVCGNAFSVLRQFRAEARKFDLILLDPPKFAQHKGQIESASNGYKDINLLAFQLLKPGGLLVTFSCSGLISADLFQKIVFGALVDAKREAQILERLTAAADHPVALTHPEGFYLKGLVCQVW
jgi:23S rRNA (cytosine1962-C5)-methyltransferase